MTWRNPVVPSTRLVSSVGFVKVYNWRFGQRNRHRSRSVIFRELVDRTRRTNLASLRYRTLECLQEVPELKPLANKAADLWRAHRALDYLPAISARQNHPDIGTDVRSYLTGAAEYPPFDYSSPGFFTRIARLFPTRTVNLGTRVRPLDPHQPIPGRPDWEMVETPATLPTTWPFSVAVTRRCWLVTRSPPWTSTASS